MLTYDALIEFERTVSLAERGDKKAVELTREVCKALVDHVPYEEIPVIGRLLVSHISANSNAYLSHV